MSDGVEPKYGSSAEQSQRVEVHQRLDQVEQELARLRKGQGMIGHNQPPSDQRIENEEAEVLGATRDVRQELAKAEPSIQTVAEKGRVLFRVAQLWQRIRSGSTKAGQVVAEKARERAAEAVVTVAVSAAGGTYHETIGEAVHAAASSIAQWLNLVLG